MHGSSPSSSVIYSAFAGNAIFLYRIVLRYNKVEIYSKRLCEETRGSFREALYAQKIEIFNLATAHTQCTPCYKAIKKHSFFTSNSRYAIDTTLTE